MYLSSDVWNHMETTWLGIEVMQNPLDMWIKQEIVWETKPTLIIETGTAGGGTALYYACILDQIGKGRVISIDIKDEKPRFRHKKITFIKGNSVDSDIVEQIKEMINPDDRIMINLDSDHKMEHVLMELRIYGGMVSERCYMVVDDTNLGGHPIITSAVPGGGPWEAVETFLQEDQTFEIDERRHKFYMTFCPNGFLRKKLTVKEEICTTTQ